MTVDNGDVDGEADVLDDAATVDNTYMSDGLARMHYPQRALPGGDDVDVITADALRSATRLALGAAGLALLALRAVLDVSSSPRTTPNGRERAGAVPPPTETFQRVATTAVGVGVEAQRRCLNAAAVVGGPVATTLSAVIEAASARGPMAIVARRLHTWSEQGLAEQRRNQEVTLASGQAVIRAIVTAVLAEVDLDEVIARVDLDRVVSRIDIDQIAARIDLDAIAARLDLDAVAARLDVNAVVDRVDLSRVTTRVLDEIDVDAIAARLDLDAVAARLDVNAVVDRVDLAHVTEQLLEEVDVAHIVRESSGAMAAETVDAVRLQSMRADRFLSRIVDRVLLRTEGRNTAPPMTPGLAPMAEL